CLDVIFTGPSVGEAALAKEQGQPAMFSLHLFHDSYYREINAFVNCNDPALSGRNLLRKSPTKNNILRLGAGVFSQCRRP
ncbi:MAG: hypothetical protein U1D35_12895, partial [Paracoccaceae bacterium]|nr:hypothetical protein [Paracoccaceae bacterium]